MIDLDRLHELLDKAMVGADSGCMVTAAAYIKLAHQEILERMSDLKPSLEKDRVRSAYSYVEKIRSQRKSLTDQINLLTEFWIGYDDGQFERTLPARPRAAYRRGYRYGRDGS